MNAIFVNHLNNELIANKIQLFVSFITQSIVNSIYKINTENDSQNDP